MTAAEYVFQNAKPSTTYHVYVKNVYMGASSGWTHATFETEVKYPAVVNLSTDNVTETSFHVTWEKHPFGTETRRNVYVKNKTTGDTVFTKVVKTTPECNVTGLTASTTYEISVRAVVGSFTSEATTAEVTTAGTQSAPSFYNEKVNDTRMEYNLYVRGIYMVVIRCKQEQTLKVVY